MHDDLKVLEPNFCGHRILLLTDNINVYVGIRSIVEGMGLIWYRQKKKINNERRIQRFNFRCKHRSYNTIFLHINFVQDYLNQLDIVRIPTHKRETVILYKNGLIDFIDDILPLNKKSICDSYTDSGIKGIEKLIRDIAKMNYSKGYESIAKILSHLMSSSKLTIDQLILTSNIYEVAEYLSKNQFRIKNKQ